MPGTQEEGRLTGGPLALEVGVGQSFTTNQLG